MKTTQLLKYRNIAHKLNYEFVVDAMGDICIRPQIFENGVRQVRHYPDPCDFKPKDKAISMLVHLASKQESQF